MTMEPLPLRGVPKPKVCVDCPPRPGKRPLPIVAPGPRCYRCHQAWRKRRRVQQHEAVSQRQYGMPSGFFRRLLEFQGHACGGCGRRLNRPQRDHDHSIDDPTRSIRGCLCRKCNDFLGYIRDDQDVLRRLLRYLQDPPAQRLLVGWDGESGEAQ